MRSFLPFVVLSLGLLATAGPALSPYTLHEKRTHVPAGWTLKRRHDPSTPIPLRFALTQKNINDVGKYLMEVSHPDSELYGKHWSAGDVLKTFAPSDETIEAVRSWLLEGGIESHRIQLTQNKGWIEVAATVEEAERLLQTEYNLYSHTSGKEHVACDAYHLPGHVVPHVDFVTPSIHFDAKLTRRDSTQPAHSIGQPGSGIGPKTTGKLQAQLPSDTSTCNEYITLDCLRALYGLEYTPSATGSNSYGIVEYTPQAYLQTDLDMFFGNFSPSQNGTSPYLVSIDGGYAQTEYQGFGYNGESDLDLQYAMGLLGPSQTVTLYQVGDIVEGASFNNFLDALDGSYCTFEGGDGPGDPAYPDPFGGGDGYEGPEACGTVTPANVISTSYGYDEVELSAFYTARQCAEYAKLGLMGVTVLYSSGDYGVAGNGGFCLNLDGSLSTNGTMFNPTFPGTCPYITSVGATMIPPNSTVYDPETACEEVIYSGGGFSNYFTMPSYQKSAVESYLTNYYPSYPTNIWNATGSRAYPDISANGANYIVAIDGGFELVYGTSCSSPVSGAIFTMVNDARIAAGKSTIGFINPTIYSSQFAGVFTDITTGNNPGCGTNGFNATVGWDPVTGLGTPNLPKLLQAWLALP